MSFKIFILTVWLLILNSCIATPEINSNIEQSCNLYTRSMKLKVNNMIDNTPYVMAHETVDLIASGCDEAECLLIYAPITTASALSFVVSGSIVVIGNTMHWVEEQGRCSNSFTRRTVTKLLKKTKKSGGFIIGSLDKLNDLVQKSM